MFHQYTIRVLGDWRDTVKQKLADQGIGSMIYYPIPQDELPVYKEQYPINAVSKELSNQVLSLPIWPELDEATIHKIVSALAN